MKKQERTFKSHFKHLSKNSKTKKCTSLIFKSTLKWHFYTCYEWLLGGKPHCTRQDLLLNKHAQDQTVNLIFIPDLIHTIKYYQLGTNGIDKLTAMIKFLNGQKISCSFVKENWETYEHFAIKIIKSLELNYWMWYSDNLQKKL